MLFRLDKSKKVILNQDAVMLCPDLKDLTQEQLLYIVLAYDYKSPFHQLPEGERIRRAKFQVWGDSNVAVEGAELKVGIESYKSLQYDHDRELMLKYKTTIDRFGSMLVDETNPKRLKEIDEGIERLNSRLTTLQKKVETNEEMEVLRGGGELTWIEKWQKNMREYKASKAKSGVEVIE